MSTPFLARFVDRFVSALEREGDLELVPGARDEVVAEVAERLARAGEGAQAVRAFAEALVACEGVVELFADDARLYEVMGDLGSDWMRG